MKKTEVLELKPLKNKKIFVFLIKKETNELTDDEIEILNDVLEKSDIKLATIALENNQLDNFKSTELSKFLNENMLPCYQVDIPEYAKGYLFNEILEEMKELEALKSEYNDMNDKNSFKGDYLKSLIEYLEQRVQEKNEYIEIKIKSQWIVKNILNIIRYYEDSLFYEETIYIIHFSSERLLHNLKQVLEELGVYVIVGEIESKISASVEPLMSWEVDLCKFSN